MTDDPYHVPPGYVQFWTGPVAPQGWRILDIEEVKELEALWGGNGLDSYMQEQGVGVSIMKEPFDLAAAIQQVKDERATS